MAHGVFETYKRRKPNTPKSAPKSVVVRRHTKNK